MSDTNFSNVGTPPALIKPVLLLPSDYTRVIDCAAECFKQWAPLKTHFVRNGLFSDIEETQDGVSLHPLVPAEFASEIERPFDLQVLVKNRKGKVEPKPSRCNERDAKVLLLTKEMKQHSLPLRLIADSPVLIERDGQPVVLQKGYHSDAGGIYVAKDMVIPEIPLDEAVKILTDELFADYKWVSPSDLSRAVAQVILPALKLGNLLPGADFPLDLSLADQSQAGKTHRCRFTAVIYGEQAYPVVIQIGGPGGFDETLGTALCSGKLFITIDNLRGNIDSQLLESTLRGIGAVPVRLPYHGVVLIQTGQSLIQVTSNKATLTQDLVNRSIIVNNQKQPKNYTPKLPWGEDFIELIKRKQGRFLGAVFAVVREWIRRGKPRTNENRHTFKAWVQSQDWILQTIFKLPPLLDDHASLFVSDETLVWFRSLTIAVAKTHQNLPVTLQAWELNEICDAHAIPIPRLRADIQDERIKLQHMGSLLKRVFRESDIISLESYEVERTAEKSSLQHHDAKKYTFRYAKQRISSHGLNKVPQTPLKSRISPHV